MVKNNNKIQKNNDNNYNILSDDSGDIKNIYHMSDIHIKAIISQELHEHYIDMINQICNEISKDCDNSLIVIAGDVLDSVYTSDCIKMIKLFFYRLSELCPVIFFFGNHELINKRDVNAMDMVTPLISDYFDSKHKIFPLLEEGLYQYNNVIFSLIPMNATKIQKPKVDKKYVTIGCYHGQVENDNMSDQVKKHCVFNTYDFKNAFDLTMLGDCHTHQFLDREERVAYSGSISEINYRETKIDKGFIKWNVDKKKGTFIKIDGMIKHVILKVEDGELKNYNKKKMPKQAKIKLVYKNTAFDKLAEIEKKIKQENKVLEFIIERDLDDVYADINITIGGKKKKIEDIKDFDTVIKMMNDYIKDNNDFNNDISKRINEYLKKTVKTIDFKFSENSSNFKLRRLEFDNINVYGLNNVIDFDLFDKKICQLAGNNGIGKSTILTVILLGLFNEPDIGTKFDCINIKNFDKSVRIVIDFEVDSIPYQVKRTFYVNSLKKRDTEEDLYLFRNGKDITGTDNKATQKKIINLIGTFNDMVDTNIVLQRNYKSFTDLSNIDKRNIISKMGKLDVFDVLSKQVRSDLTCLNRDIPKLSKRIDELLGENENSKKKSNFNEKEEDFKKITDEINDELTSLNDVAEKLEKNKINLNKKKIEYEHELKEYESLKNNKELKKTFNIIDEDKIKDLEEEKEELEKKIGDIQYDLDEINKKLLSKKFKNFEEKKNKFEQNRKKEVDKLVQRKNNLLIDLVKIDNQNYDAKLEDVKNKISEIEDTMKENNKKIKKLNKKIIDEDESIAQRYDEYKSLNKNNDVVMKQIEEKQKEIKEYLDKQKKVDHIEYDDKCKYCVKLKNKITFEENILLLKKIMSNLENEKEKNLEKLENYENCQKEYDDYIEDLENNKKHNKEIDALRNKNLLLEKDLASYEKDKTNYEDAINKNKESIENNEEINEKIKDIDEEVKELIDDKLDGCDEYEFLNNDKNKLEKEIMETKNKFSEIKLTLQDAIKNRTQYEEKRKNREDMLKKLEELEKKKKELVNIVNEYNKVSGELDKTKLLIDNKKTKIAENNLLLKQYNEVKAEIENLSKEKEITEIVNKTLDKGGIQDNILVNNIIPRIEAEVNGILSYMTKFRIEMKYLNKSLQVYKIVDSKSKILKVSGYEHMVLGLAFRLAFCNLNHRQCKMMFFDELFTFADQNGIEKIGKLFDYIRMHYDFALVITHNDVIKKYCDDAFEITQEDGFSKIYVENKLKINKKGDDEIGEKPKKVIKKEVVKKNR